MKKLFIMLALALPMVVSAQKFGYLNTQELFTQMPELNQVKLRLDTLQNQYENQLAGMQEEFNKKVADFQTNQANLTDGVKEFRQQELAEMEQRIQLFYQTAQQDIQKKQQEYLAPLHEKMTKAINEVGEVNGFTYIFDSAASVYIGNDAVNVMSLVKAELGIK
ncbi:MAG: OmpH family outer membrane protein [Paludibacter sp.]|nr:OmpH family outer membrane protein [Bacteroidales bacterium]MCM1069759.1 OmpH family outer membrane protein [Prevotella sp.]MCM1354444.1 OmpH family outer membrane protein [Bacteroides sp.]MCM1443218.1 OmpH family outer membrane protein [Muribaculum sp.]MCM1482478.1 OmpH family outer membrane protein [Paludibacter sp.]